jgi:hypothetical protein
MCTNSSHFFSVYIYAVEQATRKAQQERDKMVKKERSTAQALNNAQHKHDLAVADEHKAANDLSVRIVIVVTLAYTVLIYHLALCRWFPTVDESEVPSGSPPSQ